MLAVGLLVPGLVLPTGFSPSSCRWATPTAAPAGLARVGGRSRRLCALASDEPHGRLILVRHGQSEWNRANIFTGWVDVDLTEQGIAEAREAGRLLAAEGLQVDEVHTSLMTRAIRSAVLMLSALNQCWVPVSKHLSLNEQHSGMMTGQNKFTLAQEHGVEQVMSWRRKYRTTPPPIEPDSAIQRAIIADPRYDSLAELPEDGLPTTESFAAVCERVEPMWTETIAPALKAGRTVMVVTRGNTLRALVTRIDAIREEDVYNLDVPTATPLLYEFDAELAHIRPGGHGVWGDAAWSTVVRHGRFLVDEERVREAQRAMRQQVQRDIAYDVYGVAPENSNADDRGGSVVVEAFQAESAGAALATIPDVDGTATTYTVRQTPPAYFFQESRRLEEQAKDELAELAAQKMGSKIAGHKRRVRCTLILLRHGQSSYNEQKIFTGWADPDLTNRGRDEARLAGQLLKATGIKRIDALYTSLLRRAVKTAWLALDEMGLQWTPLRHTWRLNERNYGALQGVAKAAACVDKFGLRRVQQWRRGYTQRPPPWGEALLRETVDRRYAAAVAEHASGAGHAEREGGEGSGRGDGYGDDDGSFPPLAESLRDCQQRLMPFMEGELRAELRAAVARATAAAEARGSEYEVPTVMVVSSENCMRGMVMALEGLREDEVPLIDVPYATPLIYQLDSSLEPMSTPWAEPPLKAGWYLGDPAKVRKVQAEIKADLPEADGNDEEDAPCLVPIEVGVDDGEVLSEEWTCE